MLQKNVIKHPKGKIEIQIVVPWIELEQNWNEIAYNVSEHNLIIKLKEEFLQKIMPQFLSEVIKENNITPIDNPKYNLILFELGKNLEYKATITNAPFVKIGDYKKIKVSKLNSFPIQQKDIDKAINDLYQKWLKNYSLETNNFKITIDNNDFLKNIGVETVEDLQIKTKKYLEEYQLYNNELSFEEKILSEIEKITTVELPDILIEDELNRMLVNLQRKVADMGLVLDNYLKNQNITIEQLRKDWKPKAEKNVKTELGLAEIARLENITVSENELQSKINSIQNPTIIQQFKSKEAQLHLRHSLRQTKTLNHLKKIIAIIPISKFMIEKQGVL